jgi:hypothetical protein
MPLFLSLASTESVSNLEAKGLVESFKSLRFLPYCLKLSVGIYLHFTVYPNLSAIKLR